MARPLAERVLVQGALVATTPISVGGVADPGVDLALAVNGWGRHYVPGTSLAGPLRHWAERNLEGTYRQDHKGLLDQVFGFQGERGTTDGQASWLTVEDAEVLDPAGAPVELRDGVGIDRATGTAAQGIRFERQALARGTRLRLELELDVPPEGETDFDGADAVTLLRHLLEALERGEVRFGGAKTRGLGRVKLDGTPEIRRYAFGADSGDIFRWLGGEAPGAGVQPRLPRGPSLLRERPKLRVDLSWHPLTPLLVKSGADGVGVDGLPLVGALNDSQVAAVLPGSSVKGALRSHAERIARTLTGSPTPGASSGTRTSGLFTEQLVLPVVRELFGTAGASGWLSVPDVYQVHRPLTAEDHRAEELEDWGRHEDHVAIDRFTGGAAESLLFSVHTPPTDGWETIVLEVDLPDPEESRTAKEAFLRQRRASVALFLLTLRDLAAGRIPLGFGVNRGHGAIAVDSVALEAEHVPDLPGTVRLTPGGGFEGLDEARAKDLIEALVTELETTATSAGGEP
ncbi:MAG TPA: RAMP superfamily CRISPR-associated protein [Thermoanaerobaculia bacterium]|nr:RAMP superfamily CRISPR-associated protein [Thermoanaerobaculia bacterium]